MLLPRPRGPGPRDPRESPTGDHPDVLPGKPLISRTSRPSSGDSGSTGPARLDTADETVPPLASALVRAWRAGSGGRGVLPTRTASASVAPHMIPPRLSATPASGLLA